MKIAIPSKHATSHLAQSSLSARVRVNNFDALRLIFASMVVVFHAGLLSQSSLLAWTTHISATFAVQAFFVVSGFLVTMSSENSSSIAVYVSKRLRRIAPAYVFVVVASAVFLSSISSESLLAYFVDSRFWRYIGCNLALANFTSPDLPGVFESNFVPAVNGSLWTIKIEVAFYCVVPFIVWTARRFGYQKTLFSIFSASILWQISFQTTFLATGVELYNKLGKQLPGQLCFFAGGAWAYYRTREGRGLHGAIAAIGALAYSFTNGLIYDAIAPVAVTAIVYWAAIVAPDLPSAAKHGDFSYGIYLYHFPIIQTLIAIGMFAWCPACACFVGIAVIAVFAVFSWRLIEFPMLHRKVSHA